MPSRPKLVILDLDGTLVDSLRDIAEAVNHSLDLLGLPTHPIPAYRYMVGEGVPMLCQRAIGRTHPLLLDRLIDLTRARYRTRSLVHTCPYPGLPELVTQLGQAGLRLAVLSNKPHEMTLRVTRAFWPDGVFDRIQGYTEEGRRKPDPRVALEICESLGCAPSETTLVGDTPTDVETARRLGANVIAVTWGFRTREDLSQAGGAVIVDTPGEVRRALLG